MMGLSIHYNGHFNKKTLLKRMIEEVKDIAEIYKWEYYVFEDEFPGADFGKAQYGKNIYGICFTPPQCETVWLTFLSNGKMSNPVNLQFYGNSKNRKEQQYLYMLSVKTQYAGIEIHKLIIHLLKHLSEKYLQDFNINDEGEYWETGNEQLLQEIFKRYTDLINNFSISIENNPLKPGESFAVYFGRLLKQINEKYKK
jgi:hypothetical protein